MTWDEIGLKYGTDKASRVEVGKHVTEAGYAHGTHDYLRHYERLVGAYATAMARATDCGLYQGRLLEIGVQDGYGMQTFAACLHGWDIIGVDKNPRVAQADVKCGHLHVFDIEADTWPADFASDSFDVIVDDAGHQSMQQRATLARLWPAVRPGGFYVIEDVGCGYQEFFGGNVAGDPPSIVARVRELVDAALRAVDGVAALHVFRNIAFVEKA